MSFRHTMITAFFYEEDKEDITELIQVLESHLDSVEPFYSKYGRLRFIAMQSRDLNNYDVELTEMPELLEDAQGIMRGDLDIAVAWEAQNEKPRQTIFTIKGRGDMTRLEYIDKDPVKPPKKRGSTSLSKELKEK